MSAVSLGANARKGELGQRSGGESRDASSFGSRDAYSDIGSTHPLGGLEGPASSSQLTIVLPTLNEAASLPPLVSQIRRCCSPKTDIVIVDDGSIDGTREYASALAKSDPRVNVILNDCPQTLARAHYQGILASRTPYVVMMDADLQHPPEVIPQMLARLEEGYEVVVASRYAPGGTPGDRNPLRGLISRVAAFIAKVSLTNSRKVTDPVSGFLGVRRNAVPAFDSPPKGYEIQLFLLAGMFKPRVVEVPYSFQERAMGESKIVNGWKFVRVYLAGVLAAKRIENSVRPRGMARRSLGRPPMRDIG